MNSSKRPRSPKPSAGRAPPRPPFGERANPSQTHPEVVSELRALLEKYVAEGRSTPGALQKNDVEVDILKTAARTTKEPTE